MDLSTLSDPQLKALHSGDFSGLSDSDLVSLHPDSPKPAAEESQSSGGLLQGLGQSALSGIQKMSKAIDSYGGAPVRSAVSALEGGGGISGAIDAYKNKFGADPNNAPTGKDLISPLGISDSPMSPGLAKGVQGGLLALMHGVGYPLEGLPSFLNKAIETTTPADIAGGVANVATDPLTYLSGPISKFAGKSLEGAASLSETIGNSASKLGRSAAVNIGNTLTGIEKDAIGNYIDHLDDVNAMIKKYGTNIANASDDTKSAIMSKITDFRKGTSQAITDALDNESPAKNLIINDVTDNLDAARSKLNPSTQIDQIHQIDKITNVVKNAAAGGKASARDLYDVKQYLQGMASGSYSEGGEFFSVGKKAQQAAKSAASIARNILADASEKGWVSPDIIASDLKLSRLHQLQDKITNKNFLSEGKSANALIQAGNNAGTQNAQTLNSLSDLTGQDLVTPAQKLGAYSRFADPGNIAVDTTGKTMTRQNLAGKLVGTPAGLITLAATREAGPAYVAKEVGDAIGRGAASPNTLKRLINIGSQANGARAGVQGLLQSAPQIDNPANLGLLQEGLLRQRSIDTKRQ